MFQSKKKSSSEKICKIILRKTYFVIVTHNYQLMHGVKGPSGKT